MNESEFEQSLRSLSPAPASPRLAEKIAAEMSAAEALEVAQPRAVATRPAGGIISQPAREGAGWLGWLKGLGWAAAGAAAAVVVLSGRGPQPVENKAAPTAAMEDHSERPVTSGANAEPMDELIAAADEGLTYEDGSPQRQLRMTFLEHSTWTNPKTGAVIEMEVPREDIVLMPVAMQ